MTREPSSSMYWDARGWGWLRGLDLNQRPLGYEPNELPDCSTPRFDYSRDAGDRKRVPKSACYCGELPVSRWLIAAERRFAAVRDCNLLGRSGRMTSLRL